MLEPPIICTCILTWSTLSYADSMWSILNCSSAIMSSFSFLMSSLSFLVFLSSSSVEAGFYKWRKISQLVIHMKNYTCCWFKLLFTVQKGAFSAPGTSAIENWSIFSLIALYYLLWNKQTNWLRVRRTYCHNTPFQSEPQWKQQSEILVTVIAFSYIPSFLHLIEPTFLYLS